MRNKSLWIKKYSYLWGLGHLYLIADFKNIAGTPYVIVHEFFVDFTTLADHTYDHKARKYNVTQHLSHDVPVNLVIDAIFNRHLAAVTSMVERRDDMAKKFLPLKEIDCGKKALWEIQFTQIFNELKVQILKEPRSDAFSSILTKMIHLPLQAEGGNPSTNGAKFAGLKGTG